jgi:hypothetical protein
LKKGIALLITLSFIVILIGYVVNYIELFKSTKYEYNEIKKINQIKIIKNEIKNKISLYLKTSNTKAEIDKILNIPIPIDDESNYIIFCEDDASLININQLKSNKSIEKIIIKILEDNYIRDYSLFLKTIKNNEISDENVFFNLIENKEILKINWNDYIRFNGKIININKMNEKLINLIFPNLEKKIYENKDEMLLTKEEEVIFNDLNIKFFSKEVKCTINDELLIFF